jgi:hypothetical protein
MVIFSAPGFEQSCGLRLFRAREREKNLPLCKAENDELTKDYMDAVVHKEP